MTMDLRNIGYLYTQNTHLTVTLYLNINFSFRQKTVDTVNKETFLNYTLDYVNKTKANWKAHQVKMK